MSTEKKSIFDLVENFRGQNWESPLGDWLTESRKQQEQEEIERKKKMEERLVAQLNNNVIPPAIRDNTNLVIKDKEIKTPNIFINIEKPAPNGKITISEFIKLAELEENKYSHVESHDTKKMISRLRKIFYNTEGWDNNLIEGAKAIKSPYKDYILETRAGFPKAVKLFGGAYFSFTDQEYYPTINKNLKTKPSIYLNQELKLEYGKSKGLFIDIGHVLCGMDAFNNPQSIVPITIAGYEPFDLKITENISAVTWLGDLASILGDVEMEKLIKERELTDAEIQNIIDSDAPAQDMLGNIDAYIISNNYNLSGKKLRVSDIFKDYYLGKGVNSYQNNRYTLFTELIGLGKLEGEVFKNEVEVIKKYSDEISDAAAFYILKGTLAVSKSDFIKSGNFARKIGTNNFANIIFIAFLRKLKYHIKIK